MRQGFLGALFLFMLTGYVNAQTTFRKASVVQSTGDTLHGFVESMEWVRTPTSFLFSATPEKTGSQTFTVDNAKTVIIEDHLVYDRFVVSISMNETHDWKLDYAADTSQLIDTVFLKRLAKGDKVNLYTYRDKLKDRYYIQTNYQPTPVELIWKKELKNQQIISVDGYRQQLKEAAIRTGSFTAGLDAQLASSRYSDKSLLQLINWINGAAAAPLNRNTNGARRGRWFAGIGVNSSRLTYEGKTLINANGLDANGNSGYHPQVHTQSHLPVLSGGYDVFFHPSLERTYLRLEAALTAIQSKHTSVYRFSRQNDEELTNRFELFGVFFSLAPQLSYDFYRQSNLRLFAGAGIMLSYATYPKQTIYQTTNKQGQGYSDKVIQNYFQPASFAGFPMGRVGAILQNKWSISAAWLSPRYLTPSDQNGVKSIRQSSLQAGVSYQF